MSDRRTGRRALLGKLLPGAARDVRRHAAPATKEGSASADGASHPHGERELGPSLAPADEDAVRSALAMLEGVRGPAVTPPSYLAQLLGQGSAAPPDARGPGSQRGNVRPVLPILRPPGAVPERSFVDRCNGCGACIDACPPGALFALAPTHHGGSPTPTFRLDDVPCAMCADLPCVAACERDALRFDAPRRIGTVEIRTFDCLAHQGSFCSTCVERCPEPGAIEVEQGRPRIALDRCTGCGVCQSVCPAPRNAVLIVTPKERMHGDG